MTLLSDSRETTLRLGRWLGETAVGGEVIGLTGPLGVGKSCLVKGIALGLGVAEEEVCSPTFVLARSHFGRLVLHHIDLYRIEGAQADEMRFLDDYFDARGVTAMEWAEYGTAFLPEKRLTIILRYGHNDAREISLAGHPGRYADWIEEVSQKWTQQWPR